MENIDRTGQADLVHKFGCPAVHAGEICTCEPIRRTSDRAGENSDLQTSDGASQIISEYMKGLAKKSLAAKHKKYGYNEQGKSIYFSKIAKLRWKGHVHKHTPKLKVGFRDDSLGAK